MGARIEEALALFQADTLDQAKIAELRGQHLAEMRKTGDAVIAAVEDAHAALSREQRKAVADWIRAQRPQGME